MSGAEGPLAWARVARAAAAAYSDPAGGHNAHLREAVGHAVTEARLGLGDVAAALKAGYPALEDDEAVREAEALLDGVALASQPASVEGRLDALLLADWRGHLRARIALHDLTQAGHRLAGGQEAAMERARYEVLQVIDTARAAGIPEATIDAEIAALRAETCDLEAVMAAAAYLCAERARMAGGRGMTLPTPAWTSIDEIARERGTTNSVVTPVLARAEDLGLIERVQPPPGDWPAWTVTLTAQGHDHVTHETSPEITR